MELLSELRLAKLSRETKLTTRFLKKLMDFDGVTENDIYMESVDFVCKFAFSRNSKILSDIYKLIKLHHRTRVKSTKNTIIHLIQYIQCMCGLYTDGRNLRWCVYGQHVKT